MDLILTGRMIDAAEALRIGLVARVYPAAELLGETLAAASTIAGYGRLAVMAAKEAVGRADETSPRRRRPLRAPPVSRPVRQRRPERRDGGVRRQAVAGLHRSVTGSLSGG